MRTSTSIVATAAKPFLCFVLIRRLAVELTDRDLVTTVNRAYETRGFILFVDARPESAMWLRDFCVSSSARRCSVVPNATGATRILESGGYSPSCRPTSARPTVCMKQRAGMRSGRRRDARVFPRISSSSSPVSFAPRPCWHRDRQSVRWRLKPARTVMDRLPGSAR
jgi:hypothetical protein